MKHKSPKILCATLSAITLSTCVIVPSSINSPFTATPIVTSLCAEAASSYQGVVIASTLNVRSGPGTNYTKVGSLGRQTVVTIVETKNGWGRIGKNRWVSLDYICKRVLYVAGSGVNVRTGPGTSFPKKGTKSNGDQITVKDVRDGWIQMTNGLWISRDYTFDYPSAVTKQQFILICNCVAHEASWDEISIKEKATVVEVIFNRVNSKDFPNSIYGVISQSGAFDGASKYKDLENFSSEVNANVIKGALYYFNNKSSFNHGYYFFCDYKGHNYFSTTHPKDGGGWVTYTCPGVGTHRFKSVNGHQVPE